MITIFSIPKDYTNNNCRSQVNSLNSWINSQDNCEITLYGDVEGINKIGEEYSVNVVTDIEKNSIGTPYLHSVFKDIQNRAKNDTICYVNSDIIFLNNISETIKNIYFNNFLLVGRRTDLELPFYIDFYQKNWKNEFFSFADKYGKLHKPNGIDYFIFKKGQITNMPPFLVGRPGWDNWLIYNTKVNQKIPIIDITNKFPVIHQNHDYKHIINGDGMTFEGAEADYNRNYSGGRHKSYNIVDSDYLIQDNEIVNKKYDLEKFKYDIKRRIFHISSMF